ncbi:MAG: hypothetical protein M1131_08005 [Actinobacteria bacterium]|nr:hypothetical protein [Actinomycetota bacterium]
MNEAFLDKKVGRVEMTQQYLAGELSLLLGQLQGVVSDDALAKEVGQLRREAENWPTKALGIVARRAVELADEICWDSLSRGDASALIAQVPICAQLREFGICASMIDEDESF